MNARERALRAAARAAGAVFEDDEPLTPEARVLADVDEHPETTIAESQVRTGLSEAVQWRTFGNLVEAGRLRRLGRGWTVRWNPMRLPIPNLAAGRGDVIKVGKHSAVVMRVDWRDPTWAVKYRLLIEKSSRISVGEEQVVYVKPYESPERIGRWNGDLEPGSRGSVEIPVPSDGPRSTRQTRTTTNASEEAKEDATMATVVKRSNKSGAKSGTKKGSTAKASTAKTTTVKAGGAKAKRTQADVDALVPKFRKHLQGGGTMRALKQEFGFSDDGPIRAALYRAGFDSKGGEHGETAGSVNVKNKTGREKVLKLRSEGAGWYRLAFLTGMSESEVKAFVSEHGGSTGRVYRASEKPAASNGKSAGKSDDAKAKAESSARKGSGKKVTRRATKADPSK